MCKFFTRLTQRIKPLPGIEIVSTEDIDAGVLEDLENQVLSGELDQQGNARIIFHINDGKSISDFVDEEALEILDADWDESKTAGPG